jgi:hypothetical protein
VRPPRYRLEEQKRHVISNAETPATNLVKVNLGPSATLFILLADRLDRDVSADDAILRKDQQAVFR